MGPWLSRGVWCEWGCPVADTRMTIEQAVAVVERACPVTPFPEAEDKTPRVSVVALRVILTHLRQRDEALREIMRVAEDASHTEMYRLVLISRLARVVNFPAHLLADPEPSK